MSTTYRTHKETPEGKALTIERRTIRQAQARYGARFGGAR